MEEWSPEAKTLYLILKAETKEEYEARFLDYKKESLDAIRIFVEDTKAKLHAVNESIDAAKEATVTEIAEIQTTLGADLATMESKLSVEIAQLSTTMDRAIRSISSASAGGSPALPTWHPGDSNIGQVGHRDDQGNWGMACAPHTSPPGGGMHIGQNSSLILNYTQHSSVTDFGSSPSRVELLVFDGNNPKLWQQRCQEYF
jgi:hypothetical protein